MKTKYKAIIIDDENRARSLLYEMLQEYTDMLEVVASCADLPQGVKAIRKFKPQLVFLDIEMPGHSGLELLDFFNEDEIDFEIIFTTAYSEYALKAFKLSAIDYLLKPLDQQELKNALSRFQMQTDASSRKLMLLKQNLELPPPRKIAIPTANSLRIVAFDDIVYMKADSNYTEIVFSNDTKLLVSKTLKNFEEVLSSDQVFFRCHKSYMVNFTHVTDVVKSDGGYLLLKNKYEVPVSSDKMNEMQEKMKFIKRV